MEQLISVALWSSDTELQLLRQKFVLKVKTNLDLLEQETVGGSGISWAICKFALCPKLALHHSVFYRPDALTATQQLKYKCNSLQLQVLLYSHVIKWKKNWLSSTALAREVMKSPPSVCPSVSIVLIEPNDLSRSFACV